MKDHLIFDTTDFTTMDDTDSVGAYIRSGRAGALVTHQSSQKTPSAAFTFVDGDVTVGTDTIAETAHGFVTGDVVQLSTTGTLPTGLSAATDYYVIRVDDNSLKLAASAKDAEEGNAVDITAAAGGGTHTATPQEMDVRALDVYFRNSSLAITDGGGSITVDATDLDIRDLSASQDNVAISDGTDTLAVNADGSINITDNGGSLTIDDGGSSITVDASQLDIDDLNATDDAVASWTHDGTGTAITSTVSGADTGLDVNIINAADIQVAVNSEYAEDSAHSSGEVGSFVLAVRQDALASSTSADGDYAAFKVNASGELYTTDEGAEALLTTIDADTSSIATDASTIAGDTTSIDATLTALSKAEDSAHGSGDQGFQMLAVRNDTLASLVDTDGDYAPLQVSANGALYVNIAEGTLSVNDAALANTAIASAANALGAANTAEDVVASPLSNRKYLYIYNNGNKKAYIGQSGVSASNGFPLSPGSYLELRCGAAIDIEWVSADTSQELRTLELS